MADGIGAGAVGGDSAIAYPILQQAGNISLARVEPCPVDVRNLTTGGVQSLPFVRRDQGVSAAAAFEIYFVDASGVLNQGTQAVLSGSIRVL